LKGRKFLWAHMPGDILPILPSLEPVVGVGILGSARTPIRGEFASFHELDLGDLLKELNWG
jgi:hypothetical protein